MLNDVGAPNYYYVPISALSSFYVIVDFYPLRMYPLTCRQGVSNGIVNMFHSNGSTVFLLNALADNVLSNSFLVNNTPADTYVVSVQMSNWDTNAIPDYTLRIYGPASSTIT